MAGMDESARDAQLQPWFNIINRSSNLALDSNSFLEGSQLRQWKINDREKQKWRIQPAEHRSFPNGVYIIAFDPHTHEEFALGVNMLHVDTIEVSAIQLSRFDDSAAMQVWRLENTVEPGWLVVSVYTNRSFVLDVMGASQEQGAMVQLRNRHDGRNQQWRLTPTWGTGNGTQFPYLEGTELEEVSLEFADIDGRLMSVLEEYGFAIVNNVLNSEDVMELQALFGSDLMDICDHGINSAETNPTSVLEAYKMVKTASLNKVPRLWPGVHKSPPLSASFGIPQGRFAWAARMHPNVRSVYRLCHREELETSWSKENGGVDGLCVGMDPVFFKPVHSASATFTDCWGHTDLNVHCCDGGAGRYRIYQSVVSLWPSVSTDDSTTVIWPKSHKTMFPLLMIDNGAVTGGKLGSSSHFSRLDEMYGSVGAPEHFSNVAADIISTYEDHCGQQNDPALVGKLNGRWADERYLREARRIPLAEGSLVIWDSRTIHQGWDEGRRLAMPVCWEPRIRMKEAGQGDEIAFRKLRIAASGKCTTHWASLGREHNVVTLKDATEPVGNEVIGLVELGTGPSLVPYSILPEFVNRYAYIQELCEQLRLSGDTNIAAASLIREMIRSEILAVL
jgi:hypothetical protein